MTSVADVAAMGKQALVMRAREITRSLEPSFFVPGVLQSFKDSRVMAEVRVFAAHVSWSRSSSSSSCVAWGPGQLHLRPEVGAPVGVGA